MAALAPWRTLLAQSADRARVALVTVERAAVGFGLRASCPALVIGLLSATVSAQIPPAVRQPSPLAMFARHYNAGEMLRYEMTGDNQGWRYRIQATDITKKDDEGAFYEEIGWSNLESNHPLMLSPSSLAFRQTVSLDSGKYMAIPDLSKVQPTLIGPITDALTFYSDLLLAKRMKLTMANRRAYFEHGKPNSWADGRRILIGQDAIDFDLVLQSTNTKDQTATLLVRHVPPKHSEIKIAAIWMHKPVAGTPNNWVQVEKRGGQHIAQVGKETFDVKIVIDENDGKILSASLHNSITAVSRECEDAALSTCGPPQPKTITREVTLRLLP